MVAALISFRRGNKGRVYGVKVMGFDWAAFYDKLGAECFSKLRSGNFRLDYDYILIDSRTGISDSSGIALFKCLTKSSFVLP